MRQKDCQDHSALDRSRPWSHARVQARTEKHRGESNRIRDQLSAMGVLLEDGKGGRPGGWRSSRWLD